MTDLTDKMRKVLARAATRAGGNICPIVDARVLGNAEMFLIDALIRRGLVANRGVPRITDAGRARIES